MIPVLFYLPGTCAFGSIVALEWLGRPFRLCRLDGVRLQSDTYKQLNSLSQVPTLKYDKSVLTESAAILQHIGFLNLEKRMTYKQGTKEFDRLNQVMSYLTTSLHTAIGPTIHPDRSAESVDAQKQVIEKAKYFTVPARLKQVQKMLEQTGWLAGDHPTIADAYLYGVARAASKFIDFEKDFPVIADFYKRLKLDPGVKFAQAIEDQLNTSFSEHFAGHVDLSTFS